MASLEPQQDRLTNEAPFKKEDGETKTGFISFGFNKKITKAKTERTDERDFLTAVEGKELKSTKSVKSIKKDLVIPLIQKNRLYGKESVKLENVKKNDGKEASSGQQQDSVESQAIKELIEESQKLQERWENGTEVDQNLFIPMLMQNKLLNDFESGDRIKVDLRPEESTEADYEQVPVKAYGLALLKGMGWKQEEGIGRTFKQTWNPQVPEDTINTEIRGIKTMRDNARVLVKLAIGEQSVTISQYAIRLVPPKEYHKYSKDLSRLNKARKEKEQRKRKTREMDTNREKPPAVKTSRSSAPSWLQRDLRVRFIDKAFKGGKYYNSKMRIEDVLAPQICVCRTDEGRLLDDIKQTMLETLRDKEKCRAMVQLERYEEKLFTLDYDSICHYVGADH
ncbi:G patch domain and KOW motifs-containing protein [Bagarius yarrelli]|uniref:G-patch domain and KOW motifs-containing protein n=1 Tax=Bagarius yarrelli TaxID=175774 RepID=A0A556U258_BAGYA|nr:G patch domain and KOW motifs-containing protein [Bagarius yarrelli]